MANDSLVLEASVRDSFTKPLRDLQKQLAETGKVSVPAARQLTQQWKSVGTEVASTSRTVATTLLPALNQVSLAGLGVGAAMVGVANQVKKWATNTESIADFAKEIGASRTELAQLRALGERFGQDWGNLQGSLRTFADNARKINVDKQNILEQFGDLGRGIQDKIRTAANFDEAFEAVMKDLQKVRPERARAVSAALFGTESWALMFRNASSKVMKEIRTTKKDVNAESDALSKEFNDNLFLMNKAIDKLITGAITPAMPQITKFLNAFADPATGGIKRVSDDLKSLASSVPAAMGALGNLYGMMTRPGWETFGKAIGDALQGVNKIGAALSKQLTPEKGDVTPESSNIAKRMTGVLGKPGAGGPTAEDQAKAKASRPHPRPTEDYFKEILGPPGDHAKALEKNTSEIKKLNDHIERQTGPGVGTETGAGVPGAAGGGVMGRVGSALGAIFGGGAAAVEQGFSPHGEVAGLAAQGLPRGRHGGLPGTSNMRYGHAATTPNIAPSGNGKTGAWWTRERMDFAVNYLKKNADLPDVGAQALVARWAGVEAAGGPGSVNPRSGAIGIAQWLGARKHGVPPDFEGQLAKAVGELKGTEARAYRMLKNATTPTQAAIGASQFERAERYNAATGADMWVGKTLAAMRSMGVAGVGTGPAQGAHMRDRRGSMPKPGAAGTIDVGRRPRMERSESGALLNQARSAGVVGAAAPQKVEGSATIDLNINGLPTPNYRARTSVDGLFKDVNLNKGRSMPMAEDNPVGRAAAGF